MYQTVTRGDFHDAFSNMNRRSHFSCKGLNRLFDYLEDLEDMEGPIELDVIAFCCDFQEYTTIEYVEDYSPDCDCDPDSVVDYIQDEGHLIASWEDGDEIRFLCHAH